MPAVHSVDISNVDLHVPDWTGDGEPVWVSVRPNLRRIHVLAGDILAAIGKRHDVGGVGRNQSEDVKLATAWLRAHQVCDLVIADAQRLDLRILNSLTRIATDADLRLWLLHRPPVTDRFLHAMERRTEHVTSIDAAPSPQDRTPVAPTPAADLPPVPPHDFHLFAAAVKQTLPHSDATGVLDLLRTSTEQTDTALSRSADPTGTTATALTAVLRRASPDNLLITALRGVQIAAWHHDLHISVDLTTVLNSEERPRVAPSDAGPVLAAYRQPYRAVTWLLSANGVGMDDIAALPLTAAAADGSLIESTNGSIHVPAELRAAVRAQQRFRTAAGADPSDPLLPHSAKALSYAITDAATDLGLAAHGRLDERSTNTDTSWLKKLGIQIRPLP